MYSEQLKKTDISKLPKEEDGLSKEDRFPSVLWKEYIFHLEEMNNGKTVKIRVIPLVEAFFIPAQKDLFSIDVLPKASEMENVIVAGEDFLGNTLSKKDFLRLWKTAKLIAPNDRVLMRDYLPLYTVQFDTLNGCSYTLELYLGGIGALVYHSGGRGQRAMILLDLTKTSKMNKNTYKYGKVIELKINEKTYIDDSLSLILTSFSHKRSRVGGPTKATAYITAFEGDESEEINISFGTKSGREDTPWFGGAECYVHTIRLVERFNYGESIKITVFKN